MLKPYVRKLDFVDKERVGEVVCGIKVKTFFKDQYFLGTKIKKIRDRLKEKTFFIFTYFIFIFTYFIFIFTYKIGGGMKVKTIHIGPQQLRFKFFGARC